MASLRWQHNRPPLLKCKSGFNLKQSRPAKIISALPCKVQHSSSRPLHPQFFKGVDPWVPAPERIETLRQKKAKVEEVVGVCGEGAVLTPASCPDDGPAREERRRCHAGHQERRPKDTLGRLPSTIKGRQHLFGHAVGSLEALGGTSWSGGGSPENSGSLFFIVLHE